MKINHTKKQRADLLALARKLDRVPKGRFDMGAWVSEILSKSAVSPIEHSADHCGYAGCAIGWGVTMPRFKRYVKYPHQLLNYLGFGCDVSANSIGEPQRALFGPQRTCGPRTVAADIRRYLKDGRLPRK